MADKTEIANEIEALAAHCRPPLMEAGSRALWLRDWCEDLAQFPIENIRLACRKYRQSGANKFPTPGQILPLIREGMPGPERATAEAWRPLTEAEYAGLSLRDKIRHQRILASEARRKAGPMWGNNVPVAADQMPDTWRRWRDIAENHDKEAARLVGKLHQSESAA